MTEYISKSYVLTERRTHTNKGREVKKEEGETIERDKDRDKETEKKSFRQLNETPILSHRNRYRQKVI